MTGRAPRSSRCRSASRSRSPTTSTSTPPWSTPRTWAACSVPTRSRCCRTGAGCRSATTAARVASSSAARTSSVPAASGRLRTRTRRRSARAAASTSSSSSASSSAWQQPRRARAGRSVRAACLRARPRQRLERPRHPGLGVPAARPLPRQVVPDLGLRLGDATLAARGRARRGAAAGSGAARASRRRTRLGARHRARGGAERRDGLARQRADALLDAAAAARPRDLQRRRPADGRPDGERDDLRLRAGLGGLADRALPRRAVSRGRRRGRAARARRRTA